MKPEPECWPRTLESCQMELAKARADRDRWQQRYQETYAALERERQAHSKTRENLLAILGDTLGSTRFSGAGAASLSSLNGQI